jgi:membrane-bound metal-dependent hydrolase YbcI (DUF457 family)
MLILGHLVIGLIIGFILYEIFHARTIIVFCAIGSVLPDIVDKLLGHTIFNASLDNGRIFFHSLGIVLLFAVVGLIVWRYYRSFSFLVVGFGVLLHQLLDMMWTSPVSWYYPFLGPYPADITSDYFEQAILAELTSVTEWIFFIAILVLALVLYRNKTVNDTLVDPDLRMQQKTRKFYGGLVGVALFVLALAVIIITTWDPFFNY